MVQLTETTLRCQLAGAWISSNENGVLGEARVKAFLLERFWVLTRSVDIEGADFLIQRRDHGNKFTDFLPPRLGVVQAKFAKDPQTYHYIPVKYVLDDGECISDFWVAMTCGVEDKAKLYLISAFDLQRFPKSKIDGKDCYRLREDAKLAPFLVKSFKKKLDAIEQSLMARKDADNERFLRSVNIPFFEFQRRDLDPAWLLMIPNEFAFIPDQIYLERMRLKSFVYGLEDTLVSAAKTMTSRDASVCVAELQALAAHAHDSLGSLPPPHPFAAALPQAVATHAKRLKKLEKTKRLKDFVDLSASIADEHRSFRQAPYTPKMVTAAPNTFTYPDDEAWTIVDLDPTTDRVTKVTTSFFAAGAGPKPGATQLAAGLEYLAYEFDHPINGSIRQLERMRASLLADYYRRLFPREVVGSIKQPMMMAD
jgi:hypothetical protein